jgi:hypothetical protein
MITGAQIVPIAQPDITPKSCQEVHPHA